MKKINEYYICDRCKKEISKEERNNTCDGINAYLYDLCEECKKNYDDYKKEYSILESKADELSKKYKFGKYLPKENLED